MFFVMIIISTFLSLFCTMLAKVCHITLQWLVHIMDNRLTANQVIFQGYVLCFSTTGFGTKHFWQTVLEMVTLLGPDPQLVYIGVTPLQSIKLCWFTPARDVVLHLHIPTFLTLLSKYHRPYFADVDETQRCHWLDQQCIKFTAEMGTKHRSSVAQSHISWCSWLTLRQIQITVSVLWFMPEHWVYFCFRRVNAFPTRSRKSQMSHEAFCSCQISSSLIHLWETGVICLRFGWISKTSQPGYY